MAYIDRNYYMSLYGSNGEPDDINALLDTASVTVNMISGYHIPNDISLLPQFQFEAVQKATAAQAHYLYLNGGMSFVNGGGMPSQVSLGKFSYSTGGGFSSAAAFTVPTAPLTLAYLEEVGLYSRRLG